MRKTRALLALSLAAWTLGVKPLSSGPAKAFTGRWDITISAPQVSYPDWMEVSGEGGSLRVRVQPRSGNVHPVTEAKIANGHLTFVLTPAGKSNPAVTWDVTVTGAKLAGVEHRGTNSATISGTRAPELKRRIPKKWSAPEPLFNGTDLSGWEPMGSDKSRWSAENGILVNAGHGANLKTTRKFDDFKLHIEYNCPDHGNSGIYLRGRYEVQIAYDPASFAAKEFGMGSIYGFLAPEIELPKTAGEWETMDITLVGRNVTVVRNGKIILNRREIPGITGGALDADENSAGPFYLQGDHDGLLQFRNITIQLPQR